MKKREPADYFPAKRYAISYECANCRDQQVWEFERGEHAPGHIFDDDCYRCGTTATKAKMIA